MVNVSEFSQITALLVIDMQDGMSWSQAGERNNPNAEREIAELLSHWRVNHAPVVHIHHLSLEPDSLFWPEQEGVVVQESFMPLVGEKVIEKNVPDAFTHTDLRLWLEAQHIEQLVVVGVSTNHSIESSVRSAGNLGFTTFVVSTACFAFSNVDFDGRERSADEVHAMSLANLHGEYATVISQEEAFALLKNT